MSPRILKEGSLIFWFHSYDALNENRASVHVGKGSQNDSIDAKIWLEPGVEIAHYGRSLRAHELQRALKIVEQNHDFLMEAWYGFRGNNN
ncbi:DUF4160 domain-containing protein [candidate division KSB1 bacterium]|nr:DUF4160 domain-containing protein [candidate division KSB1 bacterium]